MCLRELFPQEVKDSSVFSSCWRCMREKKILFCKNKVNIKRSLFWTGVVWLFYCLLLSGILPQESKTLAVFTGGHFITIRLLMPETAVIWGHFQRSKELQGNLDMPRANYTGICCKIILFLPWGFFTTRCFPKPRLHYLYIHWFSKEMSLFSFWVRDFFLGDFLRFWYNYLCFTKLV